MKRFLPGRVLVLRALVGVIASWPGLHVQGARAGDYVSPGTQRMAQHLRQLLGRSRAAYSYAAHMDKRIADWKRTIAEATNLNVEINRPSSGDRQVFADVAMDRFYKIREGAAAPVSYTPKRFSFPKPGTGGHHH